jgi:signal recognition particle GTPase
MKNLQNKHTQFIEECSKNLIDRTGHNKLINFNFSTKTLIKHFIEVKINHNQDASSILEISSYKAIRDRGEAGNLLINDDAINNSHNPVSLFEMSSCKAIRSKSETDNQITNDRIDKSNEVFETGEYKNDILYKIFKKNYNKQEEIKKEKGFNSTFFVYGFFKYKDNAIERHAPIFLINCDIQLVNKTYYKCVIENDFENCVFNYALEEHFKQEFEIEIPTEITSNIDNFECIKDRILKLKEFLREQKLNHESDAITSIAIEDRFAISSYFDSTKQSLYLEMQQHSDKIIAHPMIEFLLSDVNEDQSFNQEEYGKFEEAESIDKNYKSDYFCNAFDCDGSQLEVIKAAKDGKSFVIQGPPGTGKTQTISNIIAELVSSGKKVLFVAEKKAAIDAVLKKFNEVGLNKIFLDLHNKNISSKNIVEQIIESYTFFLKYFDKAKVKFDFTRLNELKDNIVNRSDTLHKLLPIGKTTFDLIQSICESERCNVPLLDCEIKINTKS